MGKIDLATKKLMELDDIFADIINGIVFQGKEEVRAEELVKLPERSLYPGDSGTLRTQERDVLRLWKKEGIAFSLLGIENQTSVDNDMVLRVLGYDGASYRDQINKKKRASPKIPVVTLALYFGRGKWTVAKSLKEYFGELGILNRYLSDYRINVIELGKLTEEDIRSFKSDFRSVAELLKKRSEGWTAELPLTHAVETLPLLAAILEEEYRSQALRGVSKAEETERRIRNMEFSATERIEKKIQEILDQGRNEGLEAGREEGRLSGILEIAKNMKSGGMDLSLIMKMTGLSEEKLEKL